MTYHVAVDDVTAFVLAGGRSSRMGSDKALLALGEETFLQRTLQVASAAAAQVRIVGPKERYARFGNVVEDIYSGCGPLAGIHAALTVTGTDLNLVVSVDMPRMSAGFLRWLIQQAVHGTELITVPEIAGGPQPLCAVYHKAARDAAERAIRNGDYKIGRLFAQVPTRVIGEDEMVAAGFSPELFANVNTPEEYESCRPR